MAIDTLGTVPGWGFTQPNETIVGLYLNDGFGRTGIEPDGPEKGCLKGDINRRCLYCSDLHLKAPFAQKKAESKARPQFISSVPAGPPSLFPTFSGNGRF